VPYRRKKLTFAISSPDEFLLELSWVYGLNPPLAQCSTP